MISYVDAAPRASDYHGLYQTTGWDEFLRVSAEELQRSLGRSWRSISVYDDGRLVGFGRVISDGVLYALICDMIVRPSHQGMGIGSGVLKRLIKECADAGVRVAWLVSAKGKAGFYEKHGFKKRPDDAPGMQLWLNPGPDLD